MSMREVRQEYHARSLNEANLLADPLEQARAWVDEAIAGGLPMANAMMLATVSADGQPSSRVVLLKGIEGGGFTFFTHYDSRKGEEIAANAKVSFVMFWAPLDRQLIVTGRAEKISVEQSREYFASRPHGSQLSAAASPQSRPVSREHLEAEVEKLAQQYPDGVQVPMPENWGGYRIVPSEIQFWHGRPNRLHDRFRYRRDQAGQWLRERLAP